MGRHTAPNPGDVAPSERPERAPLSLGRPLTIGTAALAALALASVPVFLLWPDSAATATDAVPTPTDTCASRPILTIDVAEEIAPVVSSAAQRAVEAGACADYTVRPVTPAAVASQIRTGIGPDAWVPDSSVWVEQVNSTAWTGQLDSSTRTTWESAGALATSPLVVAVPPALAAKATGDRSWRGLLSGAVPARLSDPQQDATGRLALFAARAALGDSAAARKAAGAAMIRLSRTTTATQSQLFEAYLEKPAAAAAFPSSEQAVAAFNREHQDAALTVFVPAEGTAHLDYPWVVSPGVTTTSRRALLGRLREQLVSSRGSADLAAAGFRDAQGAGEPQLPGLPAGRAKAVPALSPTDQQTALGIWRAVSTDMRMISVIDVSGSMKARVGDRSRIELAYGAAVTALNAFPQTSQVGLWEFSIDRGGPGQDWRELVPVRTLDERVKGELQKDVLEGAFRKMIPTVGGDTGLYDTLLAAYRQVKASYDPHYVNSVVLLTDGVNEDPRGISLAQLLGALRAEHDPEKPVRLIIVGLGDQTDARTLATIAATTEGASYTARNPADITTVFIQALMSRS